MSHQPHCAARADNRRFYHGRVEKLFKAIRRGDIDVVRAVLDKDPTLIAAVRKPPPKKDTGQQPLGIALKTANYEIARLLLERGANVNFIEDESVDGRQPVLNDAIEAAIASALFTLPDPDEAAASLAVLRLMLELGADVTATHPDSGLTPLWWAAFRVQRRVPHGQGLKPRHVAGITEVFQTLLGAGADPDETIEWVRPRANPQETPWRTRTNLREYLIENSTGTYGKISRGLLAILENRRPDDADLEL